MSLNVVITQNKLFGKKPLPLEVILGGELVFGSLEDGMTFYEGVMGEGDFIAYHPDCPGRGISVYWKEGETRLVDLCLPTPSYKPEIEAFYRMVKRITDFWNCTLTVDGNKTAAKKFQEGLADTIDFNLKAVSHFSSEVLSGAHEELTIYSALQPLIIGRKEAAEFKEKPENFGAWLYQKQNVDAAYQSPRLYCEENKIIGRFFYVEDLPCIFPTKPFVPFSATDPNTGKMLECNYWTTVLFATDEDQPIAELEYEAFLKKLPSAKVSYFDGGHILVEGLTRQELIELAE